MQLVKKLFKSVDPASIAFFRICFGLILLVDIRRYFANGWIYYEFIAPEFHFSYFGFSWIAPWPGIGMYLHFGVLGLAAIAIMLGFYYRFFAWVFFFGFTYIFLIDQAYYLNHFYFVCLISFLLACIPANACFSVDNWGSSKSVPVWCVYLLRFQVGVVYFFGGIAKINTDWLRGEPLRMWLPFSEPIIYLLSYGGLLFDLLVPFALLWKKTRPFAFACAVLFHLTNAMIFNIGIFPWLSLAATTIFFEPDWPRRVFGLRAQFSIRSFASSKLTVFLLSAYVFFQVFLPLRHFLYPSSVHWTEEGHLFAWHMKLRSKSGEVFFIVKNPSLGLNWKVDPHTYLTRRQVRKMAGKPEMILEFSHELKKRFGGASEVYAFATASVNDRKKQLLIDPKRNLAKINSSLLPADWIIPLDHHGGPVPLYP